MTDAQRTPFEPFSTRAGGLVRDILAAVIAVALLALIIFLAAMVTAAFFVLAGVGMLAGAAFWLWSKVRRRKPSEGPEILVATRGPKGWTVDGTGPSRR